LDAPPASVLPAPRVLFVSGSIGLGHVTRDLAIARELRALIPGVRIDWLAGDMAREVVGDAGESLAPESERYTTGTAVLEAISARFSLNLANPLALLRFGAGLGELPRFVRGVKANVAAFREATRRVAFDVVVGDETFEVAYALARDPALRTAPFALIVDFVGVDAMTRNPLERGAVHVLNRAWETLLTRVPPVCDRILFVGEEEDVPDQPFGRGRPSRRACARRAVAFVGHICPFDVADYADRAQVRARLGYGDEPLIVCAVGGTAAGAPLLELCGDVFPLLRARLPSLRMVIVCGPRIPPASLRVPAGVEVRGYVDRLYEHFAACDLAIVQGGGTTTLELTALRRPFLYFPLEEHFEQQRHVAARLDRHGAGVRMRFPNTTPASLATVVLSHLGATVGYPPIPTDGARHAADIIAGMLERRAGTGTRRG
jgi:UDP-N-acetylglucosamine:LPS N-acetylglucosamine transferase